MVHDQPDGGISIQNSYPTLGSLVDAAGVNGLRESNRHKAGDEEGNEGV